MLRRHVCKARLLRHAHVMLLQLRQILRDNVTVAARDGSSRLPDARGRVRAAVAAPQRVCLAAQYEQRHSVALLDRRRAADILSSDGL